MIIIILMDTRLTFTQELLQLVAEKSMVSRTGIPSKRLFVQIMELLISMFDVCLICIS